MKRNLSILIIAILIWPYASPMSFSQEKKNTESSPAPQVEKTIVPVVVNGEAQKIPAFEDPDKWIKHDLWVETEFDTDGDGKKDRMHVDVTRPEQTETEGLKLPVIYESSPYFAGTAPQQQGIRLGCKAGA